MRPLPREDRTCSHKNCVRAYKPLSYASSSCGVFVPTKQAHHCLFLGAAAVEVLHFNSSFPTPRPPLPPSRPQCRFGDLDQPLCMCMQIALFAGRRSSDRAYLLLQTWFCALNLKNYIGSSNIFACSHLNRIMEEEGVHDSEERVQQIGEHG